MFLGIPHSSLKIRLPTSLIVLFASLVLIFMGFGVDAVLIHFLSDSGKPTLLLLLLVGPYMENLELFEILGKIFVKNNFSKQKASIILLIVTTVESLVIVKYFSVTPLYSLLNILAAWSFIEYLYTLGNDIIMAAGNAIHFRCVVQFPLALYLVWVSR